MTDFQKIVKYGAIVLAVFLVVAIIGGIFSAVGILGSLFDGESGTVAEITEYTVSGNITDLEIDIGAAEFTIKTGEGFFVESNIKNITVKENDGTLIIKEKSNLFKSNYKNPVLTLCIPKGTVFKTVDITTGAGKLTSEALSAERVSLELGAGEVNINELNASLATEIEGGAGALTVNGGTLYNLDLAMGVGKLELTSALKGTCDLECGIGEVVLNLLEGKEAYSIAINNGIGNAKLDGENVSGNAVYGNGTNRIDIDGGIGEIRIYTNYNQYNG